MENLINEQTQLNLQPAEAEKENGGEKEKVSLGKFKDENALLSAYNSLQSEFTKRCQKIKELESALSAVDKADAPKPKMENPVHELSETEKENVLREYLQGVIARKQGAVLLDGAGVGVKTPVSRPKTIEQAGQLARELLEK